VWRTACWLRRHDTKAKSVHMPQAKIGGGGIGGGGLKGGISSCKEAGINPHVSAATGHPCLLGSA